MSNESAIRREVGAIALMFTGLGSIIGSGWLFGAWRAAQLAGPGAIYSWIIGAVIILFVAFTYAELGAMFPESGGAVRYGHYSHGSLVGFVAGWAAWIAIVSVIPVEAEASVQYMSSWPWEWAQQLYVHKANGQGELTVPGLSIAAVLVVIYFLLNFWSVKVFADTNSAITFFKLIVPAATAVALMCTGFHWENFRVGVHGGEHVGNLAAILTAVATSGIIFSYNGFQNPVNLAGEGIAEKRWTPEQKRRILDSRVSSTDLLARRLAGLDPKPRVFVSASAIGFYGDRGDEELTEASAPGADFLAEVCTQWEAAAQPAAAAAANGKSSMRRSRSRACATTGSSRCESLLVSPCPGKCLAVASIPLS